MKKFKNLGSNLILGAIIATLFGFFAFPAFTQMIGGGMIGGSTFSGGTVSSLTTFQNGMTVSGGQLLLPDGTSGAPSFSFSSDPRSGIYTDAGLSGPLKFKVGTYSAMTVDSSSLSLPNDSHIIYMGAASDVRIYRDAANTLALKNANNDQKFRTYGANGAYFQIASQSELLTIAVAASTTTTMTIPANAIVRGVAVYVVTVIPTAATFTVTGGTSTTAFNTAAIGVAAGSNDVGTENTPYKNGAAQTIRITPNAQPAAATGQVRVVLFYETPSAPTS